LFVVPSIYMLVAKTHTIADEGEEKIALGEPAEATV
jgi:hypothetical protein